MNGICAHDSLSQWRGSTNQQPQVCQSGLSQPKGSPQSFVSKLCPNPASVRLNVEPRIGHTSPFLQRRLVIDLPFPSESLPGVGDSCAYKKDDATSHHSRD